MPDMPEPTPIAVSITDLHLTLQQSACRADKDWLAVQAGYLKQVRDLAHSFEDVPVLCAGDVFDRWNPSPELINFALEHLPDGMICIPGQHDLPEHRAEAMHRSGYGVLKQAEKIEDISGTSRRTQHGFSFFFRMYGFGWGQEITTPTREEPIKIALIHRYVWASERSKYKDAPAEANIGNLKGVLRGYDVAITGDNHTFFQGTVGKCNVFNGGTFIRRKSDEMFHRPCCGIIYSDGSVKRHFLDTSGDRFHEDVEDRSEVALDMRAFINNLEKLGEHGLDFRAAVKQHLEKDDVPEGAKQIILEALKEQE